MICRCCGAEVNELFIDLGHAPPSNSFLNIDDLDKPEIYYPLKIKVCTDCWLVQADTYKNATDIFTDRYVYFSSFSSSWVDHARRYVEMVIPRFCLDERSFVVEVASNDGYLLQFFRTAGVPCLGIEPSLKTAEAASRLGIESIPRFFGRQLANQLREEGRQANLILGNNVLAHVPDLVDFVQGLKQLLANGGVITLEFPHLMRLVANNQFDTIYHEHFSYLSLQTVLRLFDQCELKLFDVEELPTHGGSLRIYAAHAGDDTKPIQDSVSTLISAEMQAGMNCLTYYHGFGHRAQQAKFDLLRFLIDCKCTGKLVIGYGAAAKGNTLLNYAGVKPDLLPAIADLSLHKQGTFSPGSHIPIISPDAIAHHHPDYILILPWNLQNEICSQLDFCREWGCRFVVPIPTIAILGEV